MLKITTSKRATEAHIKWQHLCICLSFFHSYVYNASFWICFLSSQFYDHDGILRWTSRCFIFAHLSHWYKSCRLLSWFTALQQKNGKCDFLFVTKVSTILKNIIMISCDSSYRITQCCRTNFIEIGKKCTEFSVVKTVNCRAKTGSLHATCTPNVNTYHLIQFEYVQFYLHNDYEMSRFIFVHTVQTEQRAQPTEIQSHRSIYSHLCSWFV